MEVVVSFLDVNKASNIIENSKSLSLLLEENNLYPNRWYLKQGQEDKAIKEVEYYFKKYDVKYKIE